MLKKTLTWVWLDLHLDLSNVKVWATQKNPSNCEIKHHMTSQGGRKKCHVVTWSLMRSIMPENTTSRLVSNDVVRWCESWIYVIIPRCDENASALSSITLTLYVCLGWALIFITLCLTRFFHHIAEFSPTTDWKPLSDDGFQNFPHN